MDVVTSASVPPVARHFNLVRLRKDPVGSIGTSDNPPFTYFCLPYFRRGTWSVTPDRFYYMIPSNISGTTTPVASTAKSIKKTQSKLGVRTVCIAMPWNFAQWSKTRPLHQLLRPPIAGNKVYNSSYKTSFRLVSLIQETPHNLLSSSIYQCGHHIKIESDFIMAAERPLLYAAAFWAWDQHGFLQSPWPHYSPTIAGEPSANTLFGLLRLRFISPTDEGSHTSTLRALCSFRLPTSFSATHDSHRRYCGYNFYSHNTHEPLLQA